MEEAKIRKLLGKELAQDDDNFLKYALKRRDLLDRLIAPDNRLAIINAPRGCGKSGLLLSHEAELRTASPTRNVVIKRYAKDGIALGDSETTRDAIQKWRLKALEWMAAQVGARIGVPKTREERVAVELAERDGLLEREDAPDDPIAAASEGVLVRIVQKADCEFWLLIDEMDIHYEDVPREDRRLAGLMHACKSLTEIPNVRVRVTIRPHIMTNLLTRFDGVQTLRSHEETIAWSADELVGILGRRIANFEGEQTRAGDLQLTPDENEETDEDRVSHFFEDFDAGFSAKSGRDYHGFHTIALGRPRWMLEFCGLALREAPDDYADKIALRKAMHDYGNNRVQYLAGEHAFHAPKLAEYINKMVGPRRTTFGSSDELRQFINSHVLNVTPHYDWPVAEGDTSPPLKIARLLYMVEVLRAKQQLGRDYRWYGYSDRPSLLASWSAEHNISWELHPVFAKGLQINDLGTFKAGGQLRTFGEAKAAGQKRNRPGSKARKRHREEEGRSGAGPGKDGEATPDGPKDS
ncbi:MAG: hypothetical protein PSV23_15910 [Brevundimonas sp.]|uniref:P-loop ATPase, Sll1717 family n=1 Tax=Brevundimonas sp. TaxID=1871086 RepID=UPI002488DE54|nr:hypothetical protein [Brevundimonas sp.]MDI1328279.1 hypothetical protein [Brevundimonas sp.]